ncbi:MAG: lysine--tRNA ligase [Zestosphaera sp.]
MSVERDFRASLREELLRNGINPYPHGLSLGYMPVRDIIANPKVGETVSTAGRVASIRRHGRLAFLDLIDDGSRIQLSLNSSIVGDERLDWFMKYVNLGDFINVRGELFYTQKGELTINVREYQLIVKALRSPPVKWGHKILDPEVRYRKRHLDLMMSPQIRRIFETRFNAIAEIRRFMWGKGFIEVETPILQPVYGGAAAKPFITRVRALDEDWYLRIALELYLKRFLVGGFNKVFEIGKNFRNEDIDVHHNPEFTMMEAYEAYADYEDVMKLVEELISSVAEKVTGSTKVSYPVGDSHVDIDLRPPFRRVRMIDGLREFAGVDVERLSDDQIKELLTEYRLVLPGGYDRGRAIVKLFDRLVGTQHLLQPTFVIDFPASSSLLAKPHRMDPEYAERFELYIAGMELANAFTELNDPIIQERYFRQEEERRKLGDAEAHPYDWDFVEALEYGMPPAGGFGLGIDRLTMILTGQTSIKEVIPFPMLTRYTA